MATVYIALGSNVGNREVNLRMALRGMTRMARVDSVSSLYESEAIGPEQPAYYNAVSRIETGLEPLSLLRFMKGLEQEIGRRPGGGRWGPRPIDLDILLYGDCILESAGLVIPHPLLAERPFVLAPLAQIAPDIQHPVLRQTAGQLNEKVSRNTVRVVADLGWDGVAGSSERVRL